MKFGMQAYAVIPNYKIAKPGGTSEVLDGHCCHIEMPLLPLILVSY
jgi:hypothetical protein